MRELARRYAQALYEAAPEAESSLRETALFLSGTPALWEALCSPAVEPAAKKRILSRVLSGGVLSRFYGLLAEKGRMPLLPEIVDAYQEAYGSIPTQFAADGYDCVYTLYTALQAAGCTSDMTAEEICEAVIPVMTEITVDGLTGDLSWVATGEVDKAFDVYVVENGTYQVA